MHTLDRSFKRKKEAAKTRKRKAVVWRFVFYSCLLCLVIAIPVALYTLPVGDFVTALFTSDTPEETGDPEIAPPEYVYAPTIVDLAGDPLIIRIGDDSGLPARVKDIDTPPALISQGIGRSVKAFSDTMLTSGVQLMTTLPSRPQDFAFFQAQKAAPAQPATPTDPLVSADDETLAAGSDDTEDGEIPDDQLGAGWGETVTHGTEELPEFKKTRIENTTSVASVVRESDRFSTTKDFIVQILGERTIDSFLQEKRFVASDAKRAGEAMKELLDLDVLGAGFVVAARGMRETYDSTQFKLVQVSIYKQDTYLGTLALSDDGKFVKGADPWVKDDLYSLANNEPTTTQVRKYRYLDAIYSAAIRNKVPTGIVGEAIQLLSRTHDLEAFADDDDELVLIYSETPRDSGGNSGKVMYAAIRTGKNALDCYVFREKKARDFACLGDAVVEHSLTVRNGMVTPVNGVLTSRFGPRKHPLLKTVRIHKGVDWAAPTGTPVFAAFDGTVTFAGDGSGYGNFIKLKHKNGMGTGYAHLNRFANGIAKGKTVTAGDVIGYVGTTGLSTGPHLHFELYRGKVAIDPLGGPAVAQRREQQGGRDPGQQDHPGGKRRQRDRQEPAVDRDRPWPVSSNPPGCA